MEASMKPDESEIVDDILNELNNTDSGSNSVVSHSQQGVHKSDQFQVVNNEQYPPYVVHGGHTTLPPVVKVEYGTNEGTFAKWFRVMRKPLIVILLAFVVFNPFLSVQLAKYIPSVFNTAGNMVRSQLRTLILSVVLGLLYLSTNLIC